MICLFVDLFVFPRLNDTGGFGVWILLGEGICNGRSDFLSNFVTVGLIDVDRDFG